MCAFLCLGTVSLYCAKCWSLYLENQFSLHVNVDATVWLWLLTGLQSVILPHLRAFWASLLVFSIRDLRPSCSSALKQQDKYARQHLHKKASPSIKTRASGDSAFVGQTWTSPASTLLLALTCTTKCQLLIDGLLYYMRYSVVHCRGRKVNEFDAAGLVHSSASPQRNQLTSKTIRGLGLSKGIAFLIFWTFEHRIKEKKTRVLGGLGQCEVSSFMLGLHIYLDKI